MSGICSKHRGHDPQCSRCTAPEPVAPPAQDELRCVRGRTEPEHWQDGRYSCPAPPAQDELREAVGAALESMTTAVDRVPTRVLLYDLGDVTDALLAGPLAGLVAERDALRAKVARVEALDPIEVALGGLAYVLAEMRSAD